MDALRGPLRAISPLATCFTKPTWAKVLVLVTGGLLCPGSRTVANCLRALGLDGRTDFCKYHRVLSRAAWSGLACARILLGLLVRAFASGNEPLVFAVDETIERRWGRRIRARGIYRDAVRSSAGHFAKASGLRWVCLTLVTATPWTPAPWALPVLTALCPSARYYGAGPRAAKKLTDVARQLIGWLGRHVVGESRGLGRACVLTADRSYCTYALMAAARQAGVTLVADMRLDARLFAEPARRPPGRRGRPGKRGPRLPAMGSLVGAPDVEWRGLTAAAWRGIGGERALDYTSGRAMWHKPGEPSATLAWVLVCDPLKTPDEEAYLKLLVASDPATEAEAVIRYYALRWSCEVTFAEVRRHLGVETQRQWSDLSIARSTPSAMALASVACLIARDLDLEVCPRTAAWYRKRRVTFSDVLAAVRESLWPVWITCTSGAEAEVTESPRPRGRLAALTRHLAHALVRCAA